MEYSRRTINKDSERDIVIGLITNDEFIKAVRPVLKKEHMTLPYSKFVLQWAYDYYDKYNKSMNKDVVLVFEENKPKIRDTAVIDSLEVFIDKLSERFENSESFNAAYQIDKAIDFAKNSSIETLIDRLKIAQLSGDVSKAEAEISNFKRVEKGCGTATSIWCDVEEAMKAVRTDDKDTLIKFPGELGKVIRPLTSDDFVAFIGAPKVGKTHWLVELGILGSLNKKNVLFLTLEMPAHQLRARIFSRITGEIVAKYNEHENTKEVEIPYFNTDYEATGNIFKRKEQRNLLSTRSVIRKMSAINSLVRSDNFRVIAEAANTMTPDALNAALDNLEHYQNFIPDIIIVDYCDIMATEKRQDHRQSINERWEALRTIGQQRKALMVTVSHTVRATLERDCREVDIVEDVRKLSHLTMCIAINKLREDKELGVQRLSVLIDRFEECNSAKQAVVAQCLAIGGVCLDSRIKWKGSKINE